MLHLGTQDMPILDAHVSWSAAMASYHVACPLVYRNGGRDHDRRGRCFASARCPSLAGPPVLMDCTLGRKGAAPSASSLVPANSVHRGRSRRDGRSANGTLTLRRSSTTPVSQASQPTPSVDNAVQHPVVAETTSALPSTYEPGPARYSKDDLLEMFRSQKISDDPSRLFISGWDPSHVNGGNV